MSPVAYGQGPNWMLVFLQNERFQQQVASVEGLAIFKWEIFGFLPREFTHVFVT